MEILSNNSKYRLIKELGILVNDEIYSDFIHLVQKERAKVDSTKIINALQNEISDEEATAELEAVEGIALSISEKCNFRCNYCIYSGIYQHERSHGNRVMSYETAIAAVKFFLELIDTPRRLKKEKAFGIGFYGGECLLEFNLAKRISEDTEIFLGENNLTE